MKVVFFGTPQFSAEILKDLVEKGLDIVAIVTQPDKEQGRHLNLQYPAVKKMALSLPLSVPILQPKKINTESFKETIQFFNADLFVVVAFGQIFPEDLLAMPKLGCVNVHTSLLPKYRGAAPIERAIMAGEAETGVTIMYMVKELDAGAILATQKVEILPEMNALDLTIALCQASKNLLYPTLIKLAQGKITPKDQVHSDATYAKKITQQDAEISWDKAAVEILAQFREVTPKPGAWCFIKVRDTLQRVKIHDINLSLQQAAPGTIVAYGAEGIVIGTTQGSIKLLKLQLEGKKAMLAEDFCRGYSKEHISFEKGAFAP